MAARSGERIGDAADLVVSKSNDPPGTRRKTVTIPAASDEDTQKDEILNRRDHIELVPHVLSKIASRL